MLQRKYRLDTGARRIVISEFGKLIVWSHLQKMYFSESLGEEIGARALWRERLAEIVEPLSSTTSPDVLHLSGVFSLGVATAVSIILMPALPRMWSWDFLEMAYTTWAFNVISK